MNNLFIRVLRQFLPLAVMVCAFTCMAYLVIQQEIRMEANNPQIQIAEDTASALTSQESLPPMKPVNISASLAPFTIVYDTLGHVVSSSAVLNGKTPELPNGVLSMKHGLDLEENRVTWQPADGVRIAAVVVPFSKGYVLVGRNMHEVEIQQEHELTDIGIGWLLSMVGTFISVVFVQVVFGKKK